MGRLSLTCLQASRDVVVPVLVERYDWLRTPRLVGGAATLEEAANVDHRGSVVVFGEREGVTYVFDRDVEARDLRDVVTLSASIGGPAVTGYHESIGGGSGLVAGRGGVCLRDRVFEPDAPEVDRDEGEPLASEADDEIATGDFDAIVAAAECLGFEWRRWEQEGPFEILTDALPDEREPGSDDECEVLRIDPDQGRPGLFSVLRWLWQVRRRR